MAKRKMKRYAVGDVVYEDDPYDEMEIANRRTDRTLVPNERGAAGTSETVFPSEKPVAKAKSSMVTKEELAKSGMSLRDYLNKQQGLTRKGGSSAPDTGDESSRLAGRYAKPALRQETMRERAEAYNAKRFAQQAENAAKDMAPRGQSRILTGIRKNAGANVGMGAGMKSGGSVSSASKRADGIAMRGKTRGKIC
jgi:hypothetical protein